RAMAFGGFDWVWGGGRMPLNPEVGRQLLRAEIAPEDLGANNSGPAPLAGQPGARMSKPATNTNSSHHRLSFPRSASCLMGRRASRPWVPTQSVGITSKFKKRKNTRNNGITLS